MVEVYAVKYRQPGQIFWRKLKRVQGDGFVPEDPGPKACRYFTLEDGTMIYVSLDAEVEFDKYRNQVITKKMSREAGQPIQTNY